jgi:hypothetical protein
MVFQWGLKLVTEYRFPDLVPDMLGMPVEDTAS